MMLLALIAPLDYEREWQKPSLTTGVPVSIWRQATSRQIMALARFLRDNSDLEPYIICRQDSSLAHDASRKKISLLTLRTGTGPLDMLKIWRWQKKHANMLILNMGQTGSRLACRLLGMRKKNSTRLVCAFLLNPPASDRKLAKRLARANLLIGGSEYIVDQLAVDMEKYERMSWPGSVVIAPGILEEAFSRRHKNEDGKNGNFVFGMAQSLTPGSGALLVVRAMAAVWQKDGLPPFEVRMFGSGQRFEEILEEARALGVINRLSLLSDQNLEDVVPLCDAWLAPGSSQMELPETLWAGFAASIPVICAQSELHKERLSDALPYAAIRVNENDPQKLARAMISVMADGALRKKLISDGQSVLEQAALYRMAKEFKYILETEAFGKPPGLKESRSPEESDTLQETQNGQT